MKRHFCLLLALIISFSLTVIPVSASVVSRVADGLNSYRSDGALIVYTNGGEHTGTNQYGYEVCVNSDGVITSAGGNNCLIPSGGFVISGHNSQSGGNQSADFLKKNARIGEYASFIESRMLITLGSDKPSQFYSQTISIDGVNTYRAADTVIVYTPSKGALTGTNVWGYEVIVRNGRIISAGGNNSAIPSDGFVVSGHGAGADSLRSIAFIGMAASYDSAAKILTVSYDEKSAVMSDGIKLEAAEAALSDAIEKYALIDYTLASSLASEARAKYDSMKSAFDQSGDFDAYDSSRAALSDLITGLDAATSASLPVEYRALWLRPTQKDSKAVADYVKKCHDGGINTLCIETIYDCTMIFPTPAGCLFEQNPKLAGFDLLGAYVTECHKLGMELHIWMPIFYVGHSDSANASLSIFTKKPEWRGATNLGSSYSSESTFQFLNPSNREACDYLLSVYKYILETYDIDGFQLDYIRYPNNGDDDFGYDSTTVAAFRAGYGVTPDYKPSASYWKDWCAFRCGYITDFVRRMRALIDEVAPDVLLGADLFSDIDTSLTSVYQDSGKWISEGLIDVAFPMCYGESSMLSVNAAKFASKAGDSVYVIAGLGTYLSKMTASDMLDQVRITRSLNTDGAAFFEGESYFTKKVGDTLCANVYATAAVTPTFDPTDAAKKWTAYMKQRVTDVLMKRDILTQSESAAIIKALDTLTANDCADALVAELEKVISVNDNSAEAVLASDTAYLKKILLRRTDEPVSSVIGDVNGDFKVNAADYILLRLSILGIRSIADNLKSNADIDGDSKIGVPDYVGLRISLL